MAHILLAEDDESMRQFLSKALEQAGHQVTSASDGLEALNALNTLNGAHYDLLLTDIVMPGIDGIELSRKASKILPKLKVMFITGFAATATSGEKHPLNDAQLLSKPFHLNDLVSQVEKTLNTP